VQGCPQTSSKTGNTASGCRLEKRTTLRDTHLNVFEAKCRVTWCRTFNRVMSWKRGKSANFHQSVSDSKNQEQHLPFRIREQTDSYFIYFYGDGCANARMWGLVNAKLRNSLACMGHSDWSLKHAEIELLWNGEEKMFWIWTYYPLTSKTADVFIWHSGLKLPFRVASWKLQKWFSQSYVTRRFSSVISASSGGDLMLTGLEPLVMMGK